MGSATHCAVVALLHGEWQTPSHALRFLFVLIGTCLIAPCSTIVEGLAYGDVSAQAMSRYQTRLSSFTRVEFGIASAISNILRMYPKVAAAAIAVLRSRGVLFFSEWVGALHGDKRMFLSVSVALMVAIEAARTEFINWCWPAGPATIAQ